jgi:exonuclease SbcC
MPSSIHNPETLAIDLRDFLATVLPGSRLSLGEKTSHLQPLVLLETNHLVAAFGCANGDAKANFETLYQEFKTASKSAKQTWDNLDLNFVFCVQPQTGDLEKLCSRIETDVYFCRKFVVPLTGPLQDTLSRLPFLPLTPLSGQSLRPASAQSFLQQCGLSGSFAKDIVVQGSPGVETIIENCISGVYGPVFDPNHSRNLTNELSSQATDSVRLKSIEIKNFRAYRNTQHFDIGKKVTVLYGPNGFGKTSFFDAVDFGATGDIGRLTVSDNQFTKVARHLDSQEEASHVSLNFNTNGSERRITRSVESRKEASLDSRSRDRKSILAELTGRDILQTDRVENFINLFRATHLFNQEDPELVKNFHQDCRLDPQIVSRMLAHQDYVNALGKLNRVITDISGKLERDEKESFELNEQLMPLKQELSRLSLNTSAGADQQVLGQQISDLQSKLLEFQLPSPAAVNQTPQATLRHSRAALEARLGQSRNHFEQLSELLKELKPLTDAKREVEEKRAQLAEKEKTLAPTEKTKNETEEAQKTAEKALSELTSSIGVAQGRVLAIEWHRANRPLYLELMAKQSNITAELSEFGKIVENSRTAEETAATELRKAESQEKQLTAQFDLSQKNWKIVNDLSGSIPSWQQKHKQNDELEQQERTLNKTLDELKLSENETTQLFSKEQSTETELVRHVSEAEKNQSDLKILLGNLQGHIVNGLCPVCGDDHGDKAELLKKIQNQTGNDPAAPARASLANARDRIKKLETDLANIRQKQSRLRQQLNDVQSQRKLLNSDIQAFLADVTKLTGVPGLDPAKIPESISKELSKFNQDLGTISNELKAATEAVLSGRTKVAQIKETLSKQLSDEAAKKATFLRINQELDALRNNPSWKIIALDVAEAEADSDGTTAPKTVERLRSDFSTRQNMLPQLIEAAAKSRREFLNLREIIHVLRTQVSNLSKNITQIIAKFEQEQIPSDISESDLLNRIAAESKLQSQLSALKNDASNLELALDSATTAAALTTIQNSIRTKEKDIESTSRRINEHRPWASFFSKLNRLLLHQQNSAIEAFTNQYGPRTSVIQRRLRSVYGFDDVEIHTRESAIHVRVLRNGVELRPTDYFSQSQQQTLLLGLFLTTCISQTWSGFAPILMDDPVTHFDDLNTYAFLDLIVGLLEAESSERQFIISTCDEKLLQLARQKFRHFREDAVFYRFEALAANGPVVRQIPNS